MSVLNQDYPNTEYIIMDGGSTDETVNIINKYNDRLAYWVSEKDDGQTDALNKGFRRCTGEILTWLNSDDYFEKNSLFKMAKIYKSTVADFYQGDARLIDASGNTIGFMKGVPLGKDVPFEHVLMPQPASFFTKKVYDELGPLDEKLHYSMDMDFWLKLHLKNKIFFKVDDIFANFRFYEGTKTSRGLENFVFEILNKYCYAEFSKKEVSFLTTADIKYIIFIYLKSTLKFGSWRKEKSRRLIFKTLTLYPSFINIVIKDLMTTLRYEGRKVFSKFSDQLVR